jgi:hypothetical protein
MQKVQTVRQRCGEPIQLEVDAMIGWHNVHATAREHLLALPGDEMIRRPAGSLTNAITVQCNRRELWPWLIQMGADRAGWYSYDRLDNGGRHSAERIISELQSPPVGTVFPALPGSLDGFVLLETEPPSWLVLGWPSPDGGLIVTWAFLLHEIDENTTRLIVRARASDEYRFHGLPKAMGFWLVRVVHFFMERKQLVEIARRAETRSSLPSQS